MIKIVFNWFTMHHLKSVDLIGLNRKVFIYCTVYLSNEIGLYIVIVLKGIKFGGYSFAVFGYFNVAFLYLGLVVKFHVNFS